jgi:hypothetical protein
MAGHPLNDHSKWQMAADKSKEVIDDKAKYGYELMTNLGEIFDPLNESNNTEFIWGLPGSSRLSAGGWYFTRMHQWYFTWASLIPTFEIYGVDSYRTLSIWGQNNTEKNDLRRKASIGRKPNSSTVADIDTPSGTIIVRKYIDLANGSDASNDYPFIRFTDVYYTYAEALMELGDATSMDEAKDIINIFRQRAGVGDISYTDQSDLRIKIRNERRKEFLFEGHRWTDLVRWGKFVDVMKAHGSKQYVPSDRFNPDHPDNPLLHVAERNVLFPLPFGEWAANPNLRPQNFDY